MKPPAGPLAVFIFLMLLSCLLLSLDGYCSKSIEGGVCSPIPLLLTGYLASTVKDDSLLFLIFLFLDPFVEECLLLSEFCELPTEFLLLLVLRLATFFLHFSSSFHLISYSCIKMTFLSSS